MNKHRPWKQGEDGFSIYVEDARGHVIADVRGPDPILGEGLAGNMARHRARAALMATAPELRAALFWLVAHCRRNQFKLPTAIEELALGALKKSDGEAS